MEKDFITIEDVNYVRESELIEVEHCIDEAVSLLATAIRELRWQKDCVPEEEENRRNDYEQLEQLIEDAIRKLEQ